MRSALQSSWTFDKVWVWHQVLARSLATLAALCSVGMLSVHPRPFRRTLNVQRPNEAQLRAKRCTRSVELTYAGSACLVRTISALDVTRVSVGAEKLAEYENSAQTLRSVTRGL